jgi:two-component system, response regulator, stage 0 sporulation protein F
MEGCSFRATGRAACFMVFRAPEAGSMAKLLVIDDDKNVRLLYEQELTDDGFEVLSAGSGREALDLLQKHRPDLVILDISMPGMDGIDVLGKILAKDRSMPVILNTAYSTYKNNFMTWSADAYVVKSGDLSELKSKVREVLRTHGVVAPRP